jgi:uncharacterized protein YqeY
MGKLEKRIAEDLKGSIKNKDEIRTSTLRMIIASIQNLAIEKKQKELDDNDVLKIISKQVKQRHDSIESFKKGGRSDLVDKEQKELEILKSYLPEQLDEKKVEEIVKKIISGIASPSESEFGNVMKLTMQELKGRADGKIVSGIVKKLLSAST